MIFHIAYKDLKIIFKDKKALAVMLLMPILIILILGSALGSTFSNELKITKFTVGVVNNDEGQMSRMFIDDVLKKQMGDLFETRMLDAEKADEMLKSKSVASVIIIPEGFTKNLHDYKPVAIEVRSHIDSELKTKIVESVVKGFSQGISLSYAATDAVARALKPNETNPSEFMGGMIGSKAVLGELQNRLRSELVKFREEDRERSMSLSGMQYYSVTMLVMFMLFGANQGIKLLVEERETKTLGRIMCTRINKMTLITGKFLGLMLVCFVQSLILIIFTAIFYRVDWGGSIPGILLVTLCSVFAGSALGMMIAAVSRTSKAADGFSQILIQLFTIIGGGMIPIYIMPDAMKFLANFTLNWWAFKGYNSLMMGLGISTVIPYCGILLLMGLLYLSVGILKFRVE